MLRSHQLVAIGLTVASVSCSDDTPSPIANSSEGSPKSCRPGKRHQHVASAVQASWRDGNLLQYRRMCRDGRGCDPHDNCRRPIPRVCAGHAEHAPDSSRIMSTLSRLAHSLLTVSSCRPS
jgi:hypothetical protein